MAVRGERLQLARTRWSDDAGNETTYLQVIELSGDGRIDYHAAFDEDGFVDAYRELENRYFAGEGVAFAEAGAITTDYMIAGNREISTCSSAISPLPVSTSRTAHAPAFPIARPRNIKPPERTVRDDGLGAVVEHSHVLALTDLSSAAKYGKPAAKTANCTHGTGSW